MILHKHVYKEDEFWEPIDPTKCYNQKKLEIEPNLKKSFLMSSNNFDQP
jgi:hypothetical protein